MKAVLIFLFALVAMAFGQARFGNVDSAFNRPSFGGGGGRPNGGYQPISNGPAYVQNYPPKRNPNPLARGGK